MSHRNESSSHAAVHLPLSPFIVQVVATAVNASTIATPETPASTDLYGVFLATMLLPNMKPNSAMARGWLCKVPP